MTDTSTESRLFRGRTLGILIIVGVLSFFASLYFMATEEGLETELTFEANSFSRSAIGHHAFVELLGEFSIPVVVSRHDTSFKVGSRTLLILAEPQARFDEDSEEAALLEANNLLLILPKWRGLRHPLKVRWLGDAKPKSADTTAQILGQVLPGAKLIQGAEGNWSVNTLETGPEIQQVQLFNHPEIEPMVATPRGVLLGRIKQPAGATYILSDPDVIANHGIGRGQNAQFALAMIKELRPFGASVVIDEIIHGFKQDPDLFRTLFERPFLAVTLIATVSFSLLIWSAFGRAAPPVPPPPALPPGKLGLIQNTGNLLLHGGHGGSLLGRYLQDATRVVARLLNAPRGLRDAALMAWLEKIEKSRKISMSLKDIEADAARFEGKAASPEQIVTTAGRIYRWKREMLDGA